MISVDHKPVSSLTTNELCKLLGISKSTLFSHEKRAHLAPSRSNRNARKYRESDVLTIMQSLANTMSGNPEYPDTLVPMYPQITELDFSSTDLTLGLLNIISEASS